MKINQEREKIIYLYKSVNVRVFLLGLKYYQNFRSYYALKLNKTYLVNICFT